MAVLIPAAALAPMRWKNGGGATTEIAVFPPGATFDTFTWRLSIADVEASGPFSVFSGIDRILMLLQGRGMRLQLPSRQVELATPFAQCAFAGEHAAHATLAAGPVRDCNLMLRRPAQGTLRSVAATAHTEGAAPFRVCHAWTGVVSVAIGDEPAQVLAAGATWVLDAAEAGLPLRVDASAPGAACIVATIDCSP